MTRKELAKHAISVLTERYAMQQASQNQQTGEIPVRRQGAAGLKIRVTPTQDILLDFYFEDRNKWDAFAPDFKEVFLEKGDGRNICVLKEPETLVEVECLCEIFYGMFERVEACMTRK